ncbi:MAG: glycoside hydrolase family 3 C-terminal domain-containing protein [Chitinophagaceae bacterium]|nr:glycoside hydrolase family 3 C-terminal domain-containing protein [Chitinophagaceae bacterium]
MPETRTVPLSPKDELIETLLAKMTLEEKCGQLNFVVGSILTGPAATAEVKVSNYDEAIRKGRITGIFNTNGAKNIRHLQEVAVKESRLGIPLLIGADIIHGYKTITPIPLGEAASWDLAAIEKSARVAARESSASGINWTFAPMVDICRDARWGRVAEGAGEDPYLGSLIAVARVTGFQGNNLKDANTIAACIKHFAAYGAPDGGRDYNTVDMSERRLRETYFPPYKAGLNAGAATIMTSFNELDGVPATGNPFLLDEVLRKEWLFKGLVVSDWQSIEEMISHGNVTDRNEAGALAIKSGVDMDMMADIYIKELPEMVKNGRVAIKYVDEAVRRTLALKYDLGLFDNPYQYGDEKKEATEILSKESRAAAFDISKKSIVLLQNTSNILPLNKSIKSIALIGPLAEDKTEQNGCWAFFGEAKDVVSVAEGIKEKVGANCKVMIAKGCDFYTNDTSGFSEAKKIAQQSDVVILAVGESAVMNGEAGSRSDIRLPGAQQQLVKAMMATGKPVIVCMFHGRPIDLSFLEDQTPAVLACWTLGTETGHAVAEVLFGDYNPSGRLPISFPRTVGQVPIYYNSKQTGRLYTGNYNEPSTERVYRSKYRDTENSPLFPFGYGLSYTTFKYDVVVLDKTEINEDGTVTASVQVSNTGSRDGEEVVQLYIRDWVGSTTRPVKELKGFQKIFLKAGEIKTVSFKISNEMLCFYREDMSWGAEAGKFTAYIGENSSTKNGHDFFLK